MIRQHESPDGAQFCVHCGVWSRAGGASAHCAKAPAAQIEDEAEGRQWDILTGNRPLPPKPPAEPKKPSPFPARALRYGPGEAPKIPEGE